MGSRRLWLGPRAAAAGQPPGTYHLGKAQEATTAAHTQLAAALANGTTPPEVLCQLYLWTALAHAQMARVQIQQAGR